MDGWAYYADRGEEKGNGIQSSADLIRKQYGNIRFLRWESPSTGLWNDAVIRDANGQIKSVRVYF